MRKFKLKSSKSVQLSVKRNTCYDQFLLSHTLPDCHFIFSSPANSSQLLSYSQSHLMASLPTSLRNYRIWRLSSLYTWTCMLTFSPVTYEWPILLSSQRQYLQLCIKSHPLSPNRGYSYRDSLPLSYMTKFFFSNESFWLVSDIFLFLPIK